MKNEYFLSVYLRIFMNHIQMLIIIAVFNLDWGLFVIEMFKVIYPVANSPTQLFSFECFLDKRGKFTPFNKF